MIAVQVANAFAGRADPLLSRLLSGPIEAVRAKSPELVAALLAGKYGLLTMGPLLLVWAMPTVVLYAVLLAIYKASGLLDRMTAALQPLMRPIGLTGRDLVRVIMGMGCNVPAIISTRSCSSCTRGASMHAIGFGSPCSYQFGATLGVFAALKQPWLIWPFLAYLTATTLIYTRLISDPRARSRLNILTIEGRSFPFVPGLAASESRLAGNERDVDRICTAVPSHLLRHYAGGVVARLGRHRGENCVISGTTDGRVPPPLPIRCRAADGFHPQRWTFAAG